MGWIDEEDFTREILFAALTNELEAPQIFFVSPTNAIPSGLRFFAGATRPRVALPIYFVGATSPGRAERAQSSRRWLSSQS